jgi:hypothetical protein
MDDDEDASSLLIIITIIYSFNHDNSHMHCCMLFKSQIYACKMFCVIKRTFKKKFTTEVYTRIKTSYPSIKFNIDKMEIGKYNKKNNSYAYCVT